MRKNISIAAAINGTPGVYYENIGEPGFSVVSTNGSFQVFIGSSAPQTLSSGQSVGAADGPSLGRVVFQNTSSAKVDVTLGDFSLARPTTIQATAGTFIADTSKIYDFGSAGDGNTQFLGTDTQGRQRKEIYVTNFGRDTIGGSASTAIIGVAGVNFPIAAVFPGECKKFEVADTIELQALNANLSGAPTHLQAAVMEIFYSKPLQSDQ